MAETIGFIQTRGIGDIVIGMPAATHHAQRGHRVVWPVDSRTCGFLAAAFPWVEFLPVPPEWATPDPGEYYYHGPLRLAREAGCDRIFTLYSKLPLPGVTAVDEALSQSLTFDAYKFAAAGVPFAEKWNLRMERDPRREVALFESLGLEGEYVCVHGRAHDNAFSFAFPEQWRERYRFVEVDALTGSPFDWLYTLEGAARLVLVDSVFSNLVEQLGLPNEKWCLLRSPADFTPVLRNAWHFLTVQPGPPSGPVTRPWAWTRSRLTAAEEARA